MKRTFIAIPIEVSKELPNLLSLLKEQLKGEAINWVNPVAMHITLKFLGDTPGHLIAPVSQLLKTIAEGFSQEKGRIRGLDYFSYRGNPSVLFAGLEDLSVPGKMATLLEEGLQNLGFAPENRKFNAHLTLARIKYLKNKPGFTELISSFKNQEIQSVSLQKVIFYESLLFAEGPVYKPIKSCTLRNP